MIKVTQKSQSKESKTQYDFLTTVKRKYIVQSVVRRIKPQKI